MKIVIFEEQHVLSFGIIPILCLGLQRLIQFLCLTVGYKILNGIMILFPPHTARLTQNMELGCIKNIYVKVCRTEERNSIYQGRITILRASQVSHPTDTDCTLLSLIFTTKQKRFIASVTLPRRTSHS